MTTLLSLVVLLPLIGAATALVFRPHPVQRTLSFVTLGTSLVAATAVLVDAWSNDAINVVRMGGWPGSFAITFVADRLASVMVVIALVVVMLVLVYSVG